MKKIEGFGFYDKLLTTSSLTPLFFKGREKSWEMPYLPITLFPTAEDAARSAREYFKEFFERIPNPEIARIKFEIPESFKEEEKLSEELELIIIHETDLGLNLVGAPIRGCPSYCNTEVQASLLINNKLTPYFPTDGKSSYEIASQARGEIARQCQQEGILIAKFSLRKHPGLETLIYYSESR